MFDFIQANLVKSLYWSLRANPDRSFSRHVKDLFWEHNGLSFVYPKVNIRSKGGVLKIKSRLVLGSAYDLEDYRLSELRMFEKSLFEVDNFQFYSGFSIAVNPGAKLRIGSGYANHNVKINCYKEIQIGQNVAIAENVIIRDSDSHHISGYKENTLPIVIGDHVWIGMNSIILKGVTICGGAVIAAGSVVTHDVPERCLVGGVPARVIREKVEWD